MKTFRHLLFWLAGVILFLLITAHLTLRYTLNTPRFKQTVTDFLQRSLGRNVEYERIEYRLFPFALVMRQAAIHERNSGGEFATVKLLKLSVNWRHREITALRLEKPTLRIVQRADGSFNVADLAAKKKRATPAKPAEEASTKAAEEKPPTPTPAAAAPPMFLRLVDIVQARLEFTRESADGAAKIFALSDLDVQLCYDAPGAVPKMKGRATIGQASRAQFSLERHAVEHGVSGAGLNGAALHAHVVIRDLADIHALLPESFPAFQNLQARLAVLGMPEKLSLQLDLETDDTTATHPLGLDAQAQMEVSLPQPLADYLENGTPLPDNWPPPPPACEPPPGTIALVNWPEMARILQHAEAQLNLSFAWLAHGGNRFTDGTATAHLREGNLILPRATWTAYGGQCMARGNAQLLSCPMSYQVDKITGTDLDVHQLLAANSWAGASDWSGRLQIKGALAGQAVNARGGPSLTANVRAQIDDLQSIGTGGSLIDAVWRQLDQPLLLSLLPPLKSKAAGARAAENMVTTTRYERATAKVSLDDGTATLSIVELAMPDYRLSVTGVVQLSEDELNLTARLLASPEETARLTGGRDLRSVLPHENGGLLVPVSIRGTLRKPRVRPDLGRLGSALEL